MSSESSTSTYRLSLAHVLRVLGPAVIVVGLLWVVVAFTGVTGVVRGLLTLLTLVCLALAAVALLRPPRVLYLTEGGYRVSFVRGVGEPVAAWKQVQAVDAQRAGGVPALVFSLTNGHTTVIPLSLLGPRNLEAQRDVHDRLNKANGYRRLGP